MNAYERVMEHARQTTALAQVSGLLGWDQETMMPRGASDQRAEWMAALEAVLHARRADPRLGDWLEEAEAPDAAGAAQLRNIARAHRRATRVPERLAAEIARTTSRAQGIWAEARAANDPASFMPMLARVVALRREEGAALATEGQSVYDALLQDYEPGAKAADLEAMFDALRPRLVALRDRCLGAARQPAPLAGHFPQQGQMQLAREIAGAFGYDWARGRLDLAVHPFSSGSGNDTRITTRVDEADPFNCLYSTLHETGHAGYEQNIDAAYLLTPLGQGVSMGVHESQSRLYENQLGRSRAFTGWLGGRMRTLFGDAVPADADAFHATVNRLARGHIRTEADEVQYNLHVLLRFDLERALIAGDLVVSDLEAAWNDRFAADFGYPVDRPSNGVLQDVHWSVGLFGYFPTYTLGNVYAGCLHAALRRDLPDLDADLARGDADRAVAWLAEKVQRHGGLREAGETIAHACGAEPGPEPLLSYLEEKFGAIYAL